MRYQRPRWDENGIVTHHTNEHYQRYRERKLELIKGFPTFKEGSREELSMRSKAILNLVIWDEDFHEYMRQDGILDDRNDYDRRQLDMNNYHNREGRYRGRVEIE